MAQQCTVTLYGLSTCPHCRKAKEYLESKNVVFNCVYVDLLEGDERAQAMDTVKENNPRFSFPTLVFGENTPSKEVVVGFKAEQIDGALQNVY